ncbi:MAG: hypothetical protein JNJ46_10700 [Myxococcales bacterium]|nr:hypothetical protein [Myxococcales bacterium]
MLYTKDQVAEIVAPHVHNLRECVNGGWCQYRRDYSAELRKVHSARARASVVHDHIVQTAVRNLEGVPGIRVPLYHSGRPLLIEIDKKLTVRFKKLDNERRPRNIMTRQQRGLLAQATLPHIEGTMHLVVGYELDQLQQNIAHISLLCPHPTRLSPLWDLPLDDRLNGFDSMPLFTHATQAQDNPANLITIRPDAARKEGRERNGNK